MGWYRSENCKKSDPENQSKSQKHTQKKRKDSARFWIQEPTAVAKNVNHGTEPNDTVRKKLSGTLSLFYDKKLRNALLSTGKENFW